MKNAPCWIVVMGIVGGGWYLLNQKAPPQMGGSVTVSSGNGFSSSSSSTSYVSTGDPDNSQLGSLVLVAIVALFAISIFSKDK